MKTLLLFFFLTFGIFTSSKYYFKDESLSEVEIERILSHVDELKGMINCNSKYSSKIVFLIDMSIPSAKNRFFVYDLANDKILDQGLVAHGLGSETGILGKLRFSNQENSYCTSLGRYEIGNNYNGMFGKAYRLYGLDESNSNAYKRAIVLHKYSAIPYEEQDHYISRSKGCPMVNEEFFKRLEKIIDNSKSKIVMDVFY